MRTVGITTSQVVHTHPNKGPRYKTKQVDIQTEIRLRYDKIDYNGTLCKILVF